MKLYEVEVDATDENSEKIDQIVYSIVDLISELEEDGKTFKITIEEVTSEIIDVKNRYLH